MKTLFWFRRDLRTEDNKALFQALETTNDLHCIFIFDTNILDKLKNKEDKRVSYIFDRLLHLKKEIGRKFTILYGDPETIFNKLTKNNEFGSVYANADFEPYARSRDKKIAKLLLDKGIDFNRSIDHIIFSPEAVKKKDGDDYSVYTPYSKVWRQQLKQEHLKNYPSEKILPDAKGFRLDTKGIKEVSAIDDIGFHRTDYSIKESFPTVNQMDSYIDTRNLPYNDLGTSRLSTALRFGSISTRKLVKHALKVSDKTFLKELIWREFFIQHLFHHPRVAKENYRSKFNNVGWRTNKKELKAWKEGKTGIPIVDAGMRELNETGYMHNRVRMICANFFTKHMLMDWRKGEAYFAEKLLDYEMASNVGNWQWAAGCGCDAAPYFRIFNPELQEKKFDPIREYIKKWVPEIDSKDYPEPILDIKDARNRALDAFKVLKK